ncbi:Very low-density lipoprotein receptor precursor-like protein, partial [Leptotrombidium deliense]
NACPNMPCINLNGSYECDCRMFQYVHPIYPCKRDQKDKPLLLYITHDDIRLTNISIYASESKSNSILYSNLTSGGVIDYNLQNNYIAWSDTKQKTINIAVMDKAKSSMFSNVNSILIKTNIKYVSGIAVDWIQDLVYWTDRDLNTIEIAAVNNWNNERAVLIDGLSQPMNIALNVDQSLMVFIHWGVKPKIEIAAQDGSDRKIIVEKHLLWPTGLTIDLNVNRIYWIDEKLNAIFACDYDGRHRVEIVASDLYLKHSSSIIIFEKTIYWAS